MLRHHRVQRELMQSVYTHYHKMNILETVRMSKFNRRWVASA